MDARIISAVVLCAAIASAQPNEGWDGPGLGATALTYSVQPDQPPSNVPFSKEQMENAFVASIFTWGNYVQFDLSGRSSNRSANRNCDLSWRGLIQQINGEIVPDRGALLIASYPDDGLGTDISSPEPYAGDVVANTNHQGWPYLVWTDLIQYLTHEFGHAGMAQPDLWDCSANQNKLSIMCYGTTNREPTAYDIAQARLIYATRTGAPPDLPACSGCPVIASFLVNGGQSATMYPGFAATFEWSVSGATVLSINHGVGLLTASPRYYYQPISGTIYYTLVATNAYGSATRTVSVTVNPPPCQGRECQGGGGSTTLAIASPSPVDNSQSLTASLSYSVSGGTAPYSAVTWSNSTIGTSGVCDSVCAVSIGRGANSVVLSVSDAANGQATVPVSVQGPPYR